jgi:O-antigen/teichoic acid export membrane protein
VVTTDAGAPSVGRSLGLMTAARLVQQVGTFVIGVVFRALLGPTRVGAWNLMEVWRQQLAAMTLGMGYAADREMPVLRATGRLEDEDAMRSVTFTFTILESVAFAVGFWIYWLFAQSSWSPTTRLALAIAPLTALLTSVASAYELFIKNRKHFDTWAWLTVLLFAVDMALLGCVVVGGLRALIWGSLAGWIVRLAIFARTIRRKRLFLLRITLRRDLVRRMLPFGFPVSLWGIAYSLVQRVDTLLAGMVLGPTALGLYYLGPQLAVSLNALPTMLTMISYPNLMESFGRGGASEFKEHIRRYHHAVLIISPAIAATGFFGVQYLAAQFLPKFLPGVPAMQKALLVLVFAQTANLAVQTLLATKRIGQLAVMTIVALAVQAAFLAIAWIGGLTLLTIAWSTVVGQGAFALLSLAASTRLLKVDRGDALAFWGRIPLLWAAFIALMLAIQAASPSAHAGLEGLATTAAKLGAFLLLGAIVLAVVDRDAARETVRLFRSAG